MAQTTTPVHRTLESEQEEPHLRPGLSTSHNSHILVRLAVERNGAAHLGQWEPSDSGRMTICDDIDIPDLIDLTEWRGR